VHLYEVYENKLIGYITELKCMPGQFKLNFIYLKRKLRSDGQIPLKGFRGGKIQIQWPYE
jgi:hypothetical protein